MQRFYYILKLPNYRWNMKSKETLETNQKLKVKIKSYYNIFILKIEQMARD